MKYPHIYARALNTMWLATPEVVTGILRIAEHGVEGGQPVFQANEQEKKQDRRGVGYQLVEGLAVHQVGGIIGKRLSNMDIACGGYDVDSLIDTIAMAEADPKVWGIFLQMDTPGGEVTGTPEAADIVANATKPVFSYTDTMCCSGGVYLTAGASMSFASGSSTYGSIGVYSAMVDSSRYYQNQGHDVKVVRSGKLKGQGAYNTAVSDEHIALIQSQVDEMGRKFRAHVSKYRPDVKAESMEGQAFSGEEAVKLGFVNAIFPTAATAIEHLIKVNRSM